MYCIYQFKFQKQLLFCELGLKEAITILKAHTEMSNVDILQFGRIVWLST